MTHLLIAAFVLALLLGAPIAWRLLWIGVILFLILFVPSIIGSHARVSAAWPVSAAPLPQELHRCSEAPHAQSCVLP